MTNEAGLLFVDGMLRVAEDFFSAELIYLEMDQEGNLNMKEEEG
jgi:hypothetical protein